MAKQFVNMDDNIASGKNFAFSTSRRRMFGAEDLAEDLAREEAWGRRNLGDEDLVNV